MTSSNPNFLRDAKATKAFSAVTADRLVQWQKPLQTFDLGEAAVIPNPPTDTFCPYVQWAPQSVGAPEAWAAGCTGAGVRVAVLDGGIHNTHIDLVGRVDTAASASFVPGFPYNFDTGTFWHGTHVAGIIAASANGIGTVGIAPEATIVGVKVLHAGSGEFSWVIEGILYAATPLAEGGAGADIINMSLGAVFAKNEEGAGQLVAALNKAVNYADRHRVLVVSAAGNEALDLDHSGNLISVPAQSGSGIAVSATGPVGFALGATDFSRVSSYTNYGTSAINVTAPGGDFVYPGNENCTVPLSPGGTLTVPCWVFDLVLSTSRGSGASTSTYSWAAGTSMAAPAAAAVAAMIKQVSPGISLGSLKTRLAQSADDEGKKGRDPYYGAGYVNAARACASKQGRGDERTAGRACASTGQSGRRSPTAPAPPDAASHCPGPRRGVRLILLEIIAGRLPALHDGRLDVCPGLDNQNTRQRRDSPMTIGSRRTGWRHAALGAGIGALSMGSAFAGNIFGSLPSTADGYATWDSDMTNVESVAETGAGVYVAVLDTGLVPHWRDYFPDSRVATHLGKGFVQPVSFKAKKDVCGLGITTGQLRETTWVGSAGSTHGTHVASTILGYSYRSNFDAAAGFPLPPIMVRGIAPEVTVIPVRVLADYQVPALPKCGPGYPAQTAVFGTDEMIAAGIDYVTDLAVAGYRPMVINMSLGGGALADVEKAALDRAIANGVIVVAAAGNEGETGMSYPGAYAPVISVGSVGWTGEWLYPGDGPRYRMWWLQYPDAPMLPGSGEVADPAAIDDVYVSDFSSRALSGQELDVLAPGSWVRGPFPGDPGYNHLPWWSKGIGDIMSGNGGNFFYVGGTSMASPHVASLAALMLQKNPALTQAEVESILKVSALAIPAAGSRDIFDFSAPGTVTWDTDCSGTPCDAVGAGLVQADAALTAMP